MPTEYDQAATRWSLDDLAAAIVNEARHRAMSRSTVWRVLDDADLKPHRSAYWLNSHDPDFDAKAQAIGRLYLDAPRLYQQGRLVICCDEKTGMQILQRAAPTRPAQPGKPARREYEYVRHGTRVLFASLAVATGQVAWTLEQRRTSADFVLHVADTVEAFPAMERYDWVVDNLNTHWSLGLCELVAEWSNVPFEPARLRHGWQRRAFLADERHTHVFHFTPVHGSWLNQVELWLSMLTRRFLERGDFADAADFTARLARFLDEYNARFAHPYRWTYTGQPLVRATPFSRTRRQAQRGHAWFSPRPKPFARALYPPRPYHRRLVA